MFLALREMRRALVRFGLLILAVGLLVFLILTQQALQDALLTSFVGGIRNQSAPVLVYNVSGQKSLQGSTIRPPLEEAVRSTRGVGTAARIGQGTFTVEGAGEGLSDAAIVGTDVPGLGTPTTLTSGRRPQRPGEAVGSEADFSVGDEATVPAAGPGAEPVTLTVVGLARDIQLNVTPTLFTDFGTYEAAVRASNPDATDVLPNAIAVEPAKGVEIDQLVERLDAASPEADALTRDQAADESPGVAQVRQSFRVIFLLYGMVVPLVTGLFFLIITLQKAGSLTLLRAMGSRAGVLARSLLIQVVIIVGLGLAVGVTLYGLLTRVGLGFLTLRFDPSAVIFWSVLLMVLGVVSALVAVRRVLQIDPLEATTGGGPR